MAELRMEDQQSFFNFLKMPPQLFDKLLNRVGPRCHKMDTHYRKPLEPGLKLAITIWHLASGDKYPTQRVVQYLYGPDGRSENAVSRDYIDRPI